VNEFHLMSLFL